MNLIGITGKIGAGKSTLANILRNYGYLEYSFATPLKQIGEIFGFSKESLYGSQEDKLKIHEKWGISARYFLQKLGTDIFRISLKEKIPEMKINSSIWIELFKLNYNPSVKTVISDVRFLDEAKAIKELGGIIIKIERNNNRFDLSSELNTHVSEIEMEQIQPDFIIQNNESILELEIKLKNIINNI